MEQPDETKKAPSGAPLSDAALDAVNGGTGDAEREDWNTGVYRSGERSGVTVLPIDDPVRAGSLPIQRGGLPADGAGEPQKGEM